MERRSEWDGVAIDDIAVTPQMTSAVDDLAKMISDMDKYETVDALHVPIRPEHGRLSQSYAFRSSNLLLRQLR